jgi:hypothetical protein
MRYTKPFTLVQRQEANSVYRSLRTTFHIMRFTFPPLDRKQRETMNDYPSSDSRISCCAVGKGC